MGRKTARPRGSSAQKRGALHDLWKRISEKCPIGGIGRRSARVTPPCLAAQSVKARPRELRPPAEPPRQWRECQFEDAARAAFGADVVDQDQFAAGLQHTDEIIQRRFGIRHRGDDILRHHRVEKPIRERQILGVHHRQRFDIGEAESTHALLRPAQHRLGNVHAAQFRGARIIRQRQSGADADVENTPADLVGFRDGRLAAVVEHLAEHQIVDRRPAPIRLFDPLAVDVVSPFPVPRISTRAHLGEGLRRDRSAAPLPSPRSCAVALLMNPPPSTRACPSGAS